jgi:xanthine/uracil permease
VWLALAGGTALVLGPVLALARVVPRDSSGVRGALLGIALAALPLALFAERLKLQTHHRPLGAATYGVIALGVLALCILVAVRLLDWVERDPTPLRRGLRVAALGLGLGGLGLTLLRALGAEGARSDVLDGLRVLAVGVLAYLALDQPRVEGLLRRAGALLWVIVVAAGLAAHHGDVGMSVRAHARVLCGPIAWL